MYNLVRRQAEVEILPLAAAEKLGVITYSPLGGGLLTGKYGTSERPESGRLVDDPRDVDRYGLDIDFATADRFTEFAKKLEVKPAILVVAWTMSHPDVTAAIIGARNLTQLEDSLAAPDIDMTNDLREEISALSPAPAPATDRTETLKPNWT
jgi:aryl-alcohol dehydrogenase-like predicted oxidoreductase